MSKSSFPVAILITLLTLMAIPTLAEEEWAKEMAIKEDRILEAINYHRSRGYIIKLSPEHYLHEIEHLLTKGIEFQIMNVVDLVEMAARKDDDFNRE